MSDELKVRDQVQVRIGHSRSGEILSTFTDGTVEVRWLDGATAVLPAPLLMRNSGAAVPPEREFAVGDRVRNRDFRRDGVVKVVRAGFDGDVDVLWSDTDRTESLSPGYLLYAGDLPPKPEAKAHEEPEIGFQTAALFCLPPADAVATQFKIGDPVRVRVGSFRSGRVVESHSHYPTPPGMVRVEWLDKRCSVMAPSDLLRSGDHKRPERAFRTGDKVRHISQSHGVSFGHVEDDRGGDVVRVRWEMENGGSESAMASSGMLLFVAEPTLVYADPTDGPASTNLATGVHNGIQTCRVCGDDMAHETKCLIYVAGASKEPQRVRAAMDLIVALGGKLTLDWLQQIEEAGASNEALSEQDRHRCATEDFDAVRRAQVVWMLASTLSQGAPTELGIALADAKLIVVSGPARVKNIFASLCVEFDGDMEAALHIYNTFIKKRSS